MNHNNLRNDLIGEHRFSDAGQLLFACLFVVTWVVDTFTGGMIKLGSCCLMGIDLHLT